MRMSEAQETFDDVIDKAEKVAQRAAVREETYDGNLCAMCHKQITPEESDDPNALYLEVASWVTGPKLQSPVLRSRTGRVAHVTCVHKIIDGEAADQLPLPGMEG